jgi:hypothetical protein
MVDRDDQRQAEARLRRFNDAIKAMEAAVTGRPPEFLEAAMAPNPFVPAGVDQATYEAILAATGQIIVDPYSNIEADVAPMQGDDVDVEFINEDMRAFTRMRDQWAMPVDAVPLRVSQLPVPEVEPREPEVIRGGGFKVEDAGKPAPQARPLAPPQVPKPPSPAQAPPPSQPPLPPQAAPAQQPPVVPRQPAPQEMPSAAPPPAAPRPALPQRSKPPLPAGAMPAAPASVDVVLPRVAAPEAIAAEPVAAATPVMEPTVPPVAPSAAPPDEREAPIATFSVDTTSVGDISPPEQTVAPQPDAQPPVPQSVPPPQDRPFRPPVGVAPHAGRERPPGTPPPYRGQTMPPVPEKTVEGDFGHTSAPPAPAYDRGKTGYQSGLQDVEYAVDQWTFGVMDVLERYAEIFWRHEERLSRLQDRLDVEDAGDEF